MKSMKTKPYKKTGMAVVLLVLCMCLFTACAQTTVNEGVHEEKIQEQEPDIDKAQEQKTDIDKTDAAGDSKAELHEIMFTARQSNWGEVNELEDYYELLPGMCIMTEQLKGILLIT